MTIFESLFYTPALPGSEIPRLAVQSHFKPAATASSLVQSPKLHALEDQSGTLVTTNTAELHKGSNPYFHISSECKFIVKCMMSIML